MTYSIVQSKHNNGTGTTASVTTAATGAGNLLFAIVAAVRNPGTDTITTPGGWSLIGTVQDDPTFVEFTAGLYYLPNTTSGLTSFSWTLGTAPLQWDILLIEISGAATTSPLDVSAVHNQQVNHTSDTVSATTTVAGDLLLGVGLWDSAETGAPPGSLSDGAGWTSVATFSDAPGWMTLHIADQTQAAAGSATYAPTWTGSQDDIVWLVAFKPAAGGGGTVSGSATLTGNAAIADAPNALIAPASEQANAAISEAAQIVAPATLASNAAIVQSAQLVAQGDALASNAALSVTGQIVTNAAPLTASAALAETPAQIVAPATLQANALLAATGGQVGQNVLTANAGLAVTAQVIAPATLAGYSVIAEAAQIVAAAFSEQANAVLSATGTAALPSQPGLVTASDRALVGVTASDARAATVTATDSRAATVTVADV